MTTDPALVHHGVTRLEPSMDRICVRRRLTERLGCAFEAMSVDAPRPKPYLQVKSATSHSFTESPTGFRDLVLGLLDNILPA